MTIMRVTIFIVTMSMMLKLKGVKCEDQKSYCYDYCTRVTNPKMNTQGGLEPITDVTEAIGKHGFNIMFVDQDEQLFKYIFKFR